MCIFSIQFSTLSLWYWQGDFVLQSRAPLVNNQFWFSHNLPYLIQQYCCEEKLRAGHSWGLKILKRTKHGQFDSILILAICQFSLFLVQFSLPLKTSFCSTCHHCIESLKRFDTGMWKFFGYLVLIDCFGSFPTFNDFFYGFAVSYIP